MLSGLENNTTSLTTSSLANLNVTFLPIVPVEPITVTFAIFSLLIFYYLNILIS